MEYDVAKEYWFIHAKPKHEDECKNLPPWESFFHHLKITKMKCVERIEDNGVVTYKFLSPHQMTWHASCKCGARHLLHAIVPDVENESAPYDCMVELKFYMSCLKNGSSKPSPENPTEHEYQLNLYNEITLHLLKMHVVGFGEIIEVV